MTTRIHDYYINETLFRVQYGSITALDTDAIVSSDDTSLTMSNGVSAAIRQVGGEQIFEEAQRLQPLKVGEVVYTGAGNLKADYVFHPGIITRRARGVVKTETIGLVTRNCLQLAEDLGVTSIAFPAIGTGSAKVPFKQVAEAMLREITAILKNSTQLRVVILALYSRNDLTTEEVNQWYEYTVAQLVIQGQQQKVLHQLGDIEGFLKDVGSNNTLGALDALKRTIEKVDDLSKPTTVRQAKAAATDLTNQLNLLPTDSIIGQNNSLLQQFQRVRLAVMQHLLNLRTLSASKQKRTPKADKDAHTALQQEIALLEAQLTPFEVSELNANIQSNMAKIPSRDIMEGNTKSGNRGAAPAQKNHLLAIAVNDYSGFNRLTNAVKDAEDFIQVMQTRYSYTPDRTYRLFNSDATRDNIYTKLEELTNLTDGDNLLIYFSGHGFYDKKLKQGYWIPVDAKPKRAAGYLENSSLNTYISALPCRHVLIIADACFSGALLKSDRSAASERLSWMKSRWAIVSGRLEEVSDGNPGGNSPFATYLLNYLRQANDAFAADDLSAYIAKAVANNADQLPQGAPMRNVGDDGGLLYFYPDGKGQEADPKPADPKPPHTGPSRGDDTPPPPSDSPLSLYALARKTIKSGDLGKALNLVSDRNEDPRYVNTLIQLLARYNRLENQINMGTVAPDQQNVQTAQITNAFLEVLNKMEKEDFV